MNSIKIYPTHTPLRAHANGIAVFIRKQKSHNYRFTFTPRHEGNCWADAPSSAD